MPFSSSSSCNSATPRHCSRSATSASSFASCFGASAPLSPRRASKHSSLAGLACANYSRLRWSDIHDDYGEEKRCGDWPGLPCQEWPAPKPASPRASLFRRRSDSSYASEGEQEIHERTNRVLKLGRTRSAAVRSGDYPKKSALEDEGLQYIKSPKGSTEKSEVQEPDHARIGGRGMKGRLRIRTKSCRKESSSEAGVHFPAEGSPRRASFGVRVREACAHVMESARKGSPHLCELFGGNHLLMQVPAASSFHKRSYSRNSSAPPSPYALHSISNNAY